MTAYSFRSVTFELEGSDLWISSPPPPETLESRRPIPYSNITIVDDGGSGLRVWSCTIYVLPAAKAAMEANLRQIGSLVTPDATYAQTKLSRLSDCRTTLGRERWSYSAEFICSS